MPKRSLLAALVAVLLVTPVARADQPAGLTKTQALNAILANAHRNVVTHTQAETGEFGFVRATGSDVLARDDASRPAAARAFSFLKTYGALIGMSDAERAALPSDGRATASSPLRILRVETDEAGKTHVRTTQRYRGMNVFGAQVIVTMDRKGITAVDGDFVPGIAVGSRPAVSRAGAEATALLTLRKAFPKIPLSVAGTSLGVYRSGLLEGQPGVTFLAWGVEITGRGVDERVWVDAGKDVVLKRIPLIEEAKNRVVYSPQYDHKNPDMFVLRKEGDPDSPVPMVNNLYRFTGQVYDFFKTAFGRDSFDAKGATMRTVYLVNNACPNAYWNGATTNYCPGFDDDDVVAHEWGHAYTEYTHDLVYVCQSGALNESYSDIWGETIDLLNGEDGVGGSVNDKPYPDGQRWLIGEDLGQGYQEDAAQASGSGITVLRDMWDPMKAGSPGKVTDAPYVCDMSSDGGGVHTNSGVPNHTYAMLVDGKTFNHQTVRGIGITKAAHIYFQAMTAYQTPITKFSDHAQALEASCDDLRGVPLRTPFTGALSPAITADDCIQVAKVVKAVEMDKQPPQCAFTPILDHHAPPMCPGATVVWSDDFSKGLASWTVANAGKFEEWPGVNWKARSDAPGGHTGSVAYGIEPRGGSCESGNDYSGHLWMDSKRVTVPEGITNLELRFDHYIAAERTVDGGNVKVSVNGGDFAPIPQEDYVFNAPNLALVDDTLPQAAGGNTNPLAGEMAWTGTDGGTAAGSWGTTVARLGTLAKPGDTLVLRFDFGVDCGGGIDGWYIDNVTLYSCPILPGPDAVIKGVDPGTPVKGPFTISWSRPDGATGPDAVQESSLACAPLLVDDAENGLGNWDLSTDGTGALAWETSSLKPEHDGTAFWGRALEGAMNAASIMRWKQPIAIRGPSTLTFSDWFINEGDDSVNIDVSANGGTTWKTVYSQVRSDYAPFQAAAFLTEGLAPKSVDLSAFTGKTIALRFRFQSGPDDRAGSTPFGWFVDDIKVVTEAWHDVGTTTATSLTIPGRAQSGTYCYRVRTTYTVAGRKAISAYGAPASLKVQGGVVTAVKGKRTSRRLPATGVGDTLPAAMLLFVIAAFAARLRKQT